jgi:hypothetical protein
MDADQIQDADIVVVRTFRSAPTAGLKACTTAISSQALKACTTFNQKTL